MSTEQNEELIYKNNRELHYSFDPEKGFSRKIDYQNPGNQVIIQQSWEVAEQRLMDISNQVKAGKYSPIAWHMEKNLMELPMLSAYTGFMKWRIKRHLKPSVFNKLKPAVLEKYASVFKISVEQLTNPPLN